MRLLVMTQKKSRLQNLRKKPLLGHANHQGFVVKKSKIPPFFLSTQYLVLPISLSAMTWGNDDGEFTNLKKHQRSQGRGGFLTRL